MVDSIAEQNVDIIDGVWYAIVFNFYAFTDPTTFEQGGTVTVRLGNTERIINRVLDFYPFLIMQASVNASADKKIQIIANENLINAIFGGRANDADDGVHISIRVCGDNLLTNGTFDGGAAGWTIVGTKWTYADNKMNYLGNSGGTHYFEQALVVDVTKDYALYFDLDCPAPVGSSGLNTTFSSTTTIIDLGNSSYNYINNEPLFSSTTFRVSTVTNASIQSLSVDNIRLMEIVGSDLIDINAWSLGSGWSRVGIAATASAVNNVEDIIYQEIIGLNNTVTYRISFDADTYDTDQEVGIGLGTVDPNPNILPKIPLTQGQGHYFFDYTGSDYEFFLGPVDPLGAALYFYLTGNTTYTSITNISMVEKFSETSFGGELVTLGDFEGLTFADVTSGSGVWFFDFGWDLSDRGVLLYRPDSFNLYLQTTQLVGAETGEVQTINAGKSDDGMPIYYELETQGLEFGNVFHRKKISDKIVVFTQDGIDSALQGKTDNNDYQNIEVDLSNRVNIGQKINLEGNTTTFKWFGEASEASPVLEGFYLEKVEDMGITKG